MTDTKDRVMVLMADALEAVKAHSIEQESCYTGNDKVLKALAEYKKLKGD